MIIPSFSVFADVNGMTDTDKNPARSFHCSPRDFFISDSGNVAGVLLHADPETDADRVVRADSMMPIKAIESYYRDLGVIISETEEGFYYSIPD